MNIYEKMSEIMKEVAYIKKDDNVQFKNTNYKALSEEKMTSIMHEAFIRHKLLVFPIEQTWSRTERETPITHVDVKYRIVNVEKPEEYIEVCSCGDGADTQDKGSGKAMTYAFKYMWLRTFAIPTGEDPDKVCNEEIEAKQKTGTIDEIKIQVFTKKCVETKLDLAKVLKFLKIKSLKDMRPELFKNCMDNWDKLVGQING